MTAKTKRQSGKGNGKVVKSAKKTTKKGVVKGNAGGTLHPPAVTPLIDERNLVSTIDGAALADILTRVQPVDWKQYGVFVQKHVIKPEENDTLKYIYRSIDRVLETATEAARPIVYKHGAVYCYTGTHYQAVEEDALQRFLVAAATRCGVPNDTAILTCFGKKLTEQFCTHIGLQLNPVEPDTAFINLLNGTLFFDKDGYRFEPHTSAQFIRYALKFKYDKKATAPLWQKHLDRSLPQADKQAYLAKCLALPFFKGKIEKAPVLCGNRDTGKSTTLDVYKALVGEENRSSETLADLTKTTVQGLFSRARLDGKIVNIANDISAKISDNGLAKTLISREEVSARRPYKEGFNMQNYARLVFALNTNELPPQFFSDAALMKRVALVEFDRQIASQDVVTGFAAQIVEEELPGVLNWIIGGLKQLYATERLDPPSCCVKATEKLRKENDPLSSWLEERGYSVGKSNSILVDTAFDDFVDYCRRNRDKIPAKRVFMSRLRDVGLEVSRRNNHSPYHLYFSEVLP